MNSTSENNDKVMVWRAFQMSCLAMCVLMTVHISVPLVNFINEIWVNYHAGDPYFGQAVVACLLMLLWIPVLWVWKLFRVINHIIDAERYGLPPREKIPDGCLSVSEGELQDGEATI